ncbi:Hypothetical protein R9X50_00301600 [Acrodontium crateriforme]|uniref:Uncharacterized protein n=1 Tax=Acrodontium crateriforme TaxID=150365 RepID=A0AAQ3RBG3_9PEZI|nr:Hypothetical protein R9X50_00301600 [Acrodontium crateriforme]
MPQPESRTGHASEGLRECKRYIATHNPSGKSIYTESPDQVFALVPGVGGMARSYSVGGIPATLAHEADIKAYRSCDGPSSFTRPEIVPPQPGANLLVIDLEPGGMTMMHRTVSVDYSICCVGEIEHELDGGEKVRLFPGDHVVQRGTMHRWSNASQTQPARLIAVTIPCVPFDIAGKELKEVHIPNEPKPQSKV